MGDFTVSGFYSRIPIKPGTETVAIMCAETPARMSTHPCYLISNLTPVMMPIRFEMNEYGGVDESACEDYEYMVSTGEYVENENELLIRRVTGMSAYSLIKCLNETSQYKKYEEVESFRLLQQRCRIETDKPAFHFIYEHASVYDMIAGMTSNSITEYVRKYACKFYGKNIFNYLDAEHIEFNHLEKCRKAGLEPPYMYIFNQMNNSVARALMSMYNKFDGNWESLAEDISKWCTFVVSYDFIFHGSFCYSPYGGQTWHHDSDWKKERLNMLGEFERLIKEM